MIDSKHTAVWHKDHYKGHILEASYEVIEHFRTASSLNQNDRKHPQVYGCQNDFLHLILKVKGANLSNC